MDSGWAVRRGSRAAITGHSRGHAPLERHSGGVLGLSCPPLPRVQEHAQTVRGGPQRYCVPTGVPGKQVASGGHSPESREERPPPAEGDSPGLTITPKCHGQHVPRVPLVLTCPSLSLLWGPGSPESVQPTGSTRVFSRRDPTNQSPLNDGPRSTMPVSAPSPPGPGTAGVLSDPLRHKSLIPIEWIQDLVPNLFTTKASQIDNSFSSSLHVCRNNTINDNFIATLRRNNITYK